MDLDRETKDLLISLGIDVNELPSSESTPERVRDPKDEIKLDAADQESTALEKSGEQEVFLEGEMENQPELSQDEPISQKEQIVEEQDECLHVKLPLELDEPQNKKYFARIRTPLVAAMGIVLGFSFSFISSCSQKDETRALVVGAPEKASPFFETAESNGLIEKQSLLWSETIPFHEGGFDTQLPIAGDKAIFDEMVKRKLLLEARDGEIESLIEQMKFNPDISYVLTFQSAAKRTMNAEVISGMSIAEAVERLLEKTPDREKSLTLTALEEMGLSQRAMNEYLEVKAKVQEIQDDIDQTCDLLSDEGENVVFLAETLDQAMRKLEEIELQPNRPINIALCQILNIPALKQKLIDACSESIDLLVQERLAVKQTKKKSFSFQEMKAIALLMTRMTSKGDRSRLQSLEAIEEAAFKEQEIIRTISKNIERFNALEEEIKPDSLSVSIIYPAEGALFSSAGMKN